MLRPLALTCPLAPLPHCSTNAYLSLICTLARALTLAPRLRYIPPFPADCAGKHAPLQPGAVAPNRIRVRIKAGRPECSIRTSGSGRGWHVLNDHVRSDVLPGQGSLTEACWAWSPQD